MTTEEKTAAGNAAAGLGDAEIYRWFGENLNRVREQSLRHYVRARELKKDKQLRQLYCNACRARFSEHKGTRLYRCHLPEPIAVSVLEHLAEGNGIRQTGRLVGVHRDTVVRLARAAGDHAHAAHEELVAFSPSDQRGPVRREVVLRG